jgi:hypothetical protein
MLASTPELNYQYQAEFSELRNGMHHESHVALETPSSISRNMQRVSALEIEAMIHNYGLEVIAGGIAPDLLFNIVRRQQKVGSATSSRDLVRTIAVSSLATALPALRVAAIQARLAAVHHDDGGGAALRAQLRPFGEMRL